MTIWILDPPGICFPMPYIWLSSRTKIYQHIYYKNVNAKLKTCLISVQFIKLLKESVILPPAGPASDPFRAILWNPRGCCSGKSFPRENSSRVAVPTCECSGKFPAHILPKREHSPQCLRISRSSPREELTPVEHLLVLAYGLEKVLDSGPRVVLPAVLLDSGPDLRRQIEEFCD